MCTQQCICTFRVHAPRARSDGSSNLVDSCNVLAGGRIAPRPPAPRRLVTHAVYNVGGGDRYHAPDRRSKKQYLTAGRASTLVDAWSTLVAARGGHRRGHGAYLATPGRRESAIHDCQKSNDARTRRPARPPPPHINRIVVGVVARGTNISRMSSLHERLIAGSRRRGFAVCSIVRIVDSYSKNAPPPPLG